MTFRTVRIFFIPVLVFSLFSLSVRAQEINQLKLPKKNLPTPIALIPTPTPSPTSAPNILIYQLDSEIPDKSTPTRPLFLAEGKINTWDEYGLEVNVLGRINFLKTDYKAQALVGESIGVGVGLTHEYDRILPYVSVIASTDGRLNYRFTHGRNSSNLNDLSQPNLINFKAGLRYEGEWSTRKWNSDVEASLQAGIGASDYGDRSAAGLLADFDIKAVLSYALNSNDYIKLATRFGYQQVQDMGVAETSVGLSFMKDQFFIGGSEVGVEWKKQNIDGLGSINRISGTLSVGIR